MRRMKTLRLWACVPFVLLVHASTLAQTPPASSYLRVTQDQVRWSDNPALPKGVRTAVLYGNPFKAGLFVMQVSLPPNTRLPVHRHPDERIRTVISGTYYSSVGEAFDARTLQAFPAGTVSNVPVGVWQFAETHDEPVVFEIVGIGPTGIEYLNAGDDPRKAPR
jgi:quercetin dioxygenase-like cupin family protein